MLLKHKQYYMYVFHVFQVLLSLEKNAARYKTAADENADEKPSHSYIALISMAILSVRDKKMLLGDIYQYIKENFNYYNNEEKAWKNSIRHNLSLNECFIKAGRADNGQWRLLRLFLFLTVILYFLKKKLIFPVLL